jgi:hypothetical protein
MSTTEEHDFLTFRHYWTDGGFVFEGHRKGMDPPSGQMKDLYEFMAKAVPDGGDMMEVVMIVRHIEQ